MDLTFLTKTNLYLTTIFIEKYVNCKNRVQRRNYFSFFTVVSTKNLPYPTMFYKKKIKPDKTRVINP